jgi:polysaccharide biosynthesis transport protein
MNIVFFIRLIFKNVLLIFGVGAAMASIVYLLTKNQPDTFSSNTTVYTGIATGYDIESGANARFDLFSNNAQFDNLINIIKSRETQEKTAIRLMAQHLILSKPDPKYCLPGTWNKLMGEIPVEIKRMIDVSYLESHVAPEEPAADLIDSTPPVSNPADSIREMVIDTILESKTFTERVERFRFAKKYYTIKAGDNPNIVAAKFGLTTDELYRLNSPMPPFHGGRRLVVGTTSESYWTDTIVTRQVAAVVESIKPSEILISDPDENLNDQNPSGLVEEVAAVSGIVNDEDKTRYQRLVLDLTAFKESDQENYLFKTLQSSNPFYSVQKIGSVRVTRIQSSDLLKLSFDSNDPAVCMQTLKILTDVFKSQYQSITATQTGLVSEYFRQRVLDAKRELDSLETSLLKFRMENRIINYDEQTKFISEQKETLDRDWYEEAGKLSAARTALTLVEENLGEKNKSVLQNNSLLTKRKLVYELAVEVSMEEIKDDLDINHLTQLKGELERLKMELNDELIRSFEINRSVQGLNVQSILQKWIEKAIEVEESRARYQTLTERKKAFLAKYDEFAPLGSQLKKIEREIIRAQQDYMNHLNNLNISIMKQKNVEQSDIQIIDNPVFPVKPNASKRMFTVIAAFLAGIVLTAALIILLEFLDTSIKFPDRLEELSGLKLIGAFPKIPSTPDRHTNYPLIASRSIDQITQRVSLEELRQKNRGDLPFILFLISTREQEGKTFIGTKVTEKLRASGSKVLFIKPREKHSVADLKEQFANFNSSQQAWDFEYSIPDNFISVKNMNELLRNYSFLTKGYNYIILELPALLIQEFPATIVESGNMSVLLAKATRTWNRADEEAILLYKSGINHDIMALLNACQVDQLEAIIGEIPKRRSFFRKLAKRIVNLDFTTNKIV